MDGATIAAARTAARRTPSARGCSVRAEHPATVFLGATGPPRACEAAPRSSSAPRRERRLLDARGLPRNGRAGAAPRTDDGGVSDPRGADLL
jgi:hypothetical protein